MDFDQAQLIAIDSLITQKAPASLPGIAQIAEVEGCFRCIYI